MKKEVSTFLLSLVLIISTMSVYAQTSEDEMSDEASPTPETTEVINEEVSEEVVIEENENNNEEINELTTEAIYQMYMTYETQEEKDAYYENLSTQQQDDLSVYIEEINSIGSDNNDEDELLSVEALYQMYMTYETQEEKDTFYQSLSILNQEALDAYIVGVDDEQDVQLTVQEVYEEMMALETSEEQEAYMEGLSAEMQEALKTYIAQQVENHEESVGEFITPVTFTQAGPLLPAVSGVSMSMFSLENSIEEEDESGIILDKYVSSTPNEENEYTITLASYTTGTVSESSAIPSDIILVLDQSGSMDRDFDGSSLYYERTVDGVVENVYTYRDSKQQALQQIAADFILDLNYYDVDNQVAIITFGDKTVIEQTYSSNYGTSYEWSKKEFAYTDGGSYELATLDYVKGKFTDKGDPGSLAYTILDMPIGLWTGGTSMNSGLNKARKMLVENIASLSSDESRNQVVIVFSDGKPSDDLDSSISNAQKMKATGATVYVVGIFSGANPDKTDSTNSFMNYLSSNYPDAASTSNPGEGSNAGYYLTASDAEGLSEIFQNIEAQISAPSVVLEKDIEIKDVVSEYFDMLDSIEDAEVSLSIVPCTGYSDGEYTWGVPEVIDINDTSDEYEVFYQIEDKTVRVTGFDYNKHYVTQEMKGDGSYGYKIVLSFNIKPIDGFMGGNNVPTNEDSSGLYESDTDGNTTLLKTFPIPRVNIAANLEVEASNQSIYLGNTVSYSDLLYSLNQTIDGLNNSFVDIELNVYEDVNENGIIDETDIKMDSQTILHSEQASTYLNNQLLSPETCTYYLVESLITPIDGLEGTVCGSERITQLIPFSLHVLKPSLTFYDVYVDYGTSVDFINDCAKGSLAYDYNDDGTISGIQLNQITGQPLDENGYLLNDGGFYLVDDDGNYLVADACEDEIEKATTSNNRPSAVVWETNEIHQQESKEKIELVTGQVPPLIECQFTNETGDTYTAQSYYNSRAKSNDTFYLSAIITTPIDKNSSATTFLLNKEEQNSFTVNLNTYNLHLEKTILASAINNYTQDIVFNIRYELYDETIDMKVAMPINEFIMSEDGNYTMTKTVTNLYSGLNAVISEVSEWSWRYQLLYSSAWLSKDISSVMTHLSSDDTKETMSLFVSYGYGYSTPIKETTQGWELVYDWSDLTRIKGSRLPNEVADSANITLTLKNTQSTQGDEWISDSHFIRNIFDSNEIGG
ncbi:MAG: vWA domain-containing protein [Erysipelotrichaceae bacterium]